MVSPECRVNVIGMHDDGFKVIPNRTVIMQALSQI